MAIVSLSRPDIETNMNGGVGFSFDKDAATKLYQMMSNYLYSDKEYAVISELSANAIDAHALVGKKETPIKVQLPTRFDPEFVVRDYGPGLSEDDVYRFLTSYGASSKGDTNEQIGFWGIGSKSPAAVSDSWTIMSYHGGKRMHFEVFVTAEGIPTLKKIFEEPCTECGLEVRVPIASQKYQQWVDAAKRAFKYYPVKPVINQNINFAKLNYRAKGDGWVRMENGGYYDTASKGGRIIVTMREYEMDHAKIFGSMEPKIKAKIQSLFERDFNGFNLIFGVGEIDLSISREQVQYNAKTMEAITKRLESIYDEVTKTIKAELDTATTNIEYRKAALTTYQKYGVSDKYMLDVINGKYGIKSTHDFSYLSVKNVDDEKMGVMHQGVYRRINTSSFSCFGTQVVRKNRSWDHAKKEYVTDLSLSIETLSRLVIVKRDVTMPMARIKHSGDANKFYLILEDNIFKADIQEVLASSFDKPPREKKDPREQVTELYIKDGNRFLKATAGELTQVEAYGKVIYVPIVNASSLDFNPEAKTPEVEFLVTDCSYKLIGYKNEKPRGAVYKTPKEALEVTLNELKADKELQSEITNANLGQMFQQCYYESVAIYAVRKLISGTNFDKLAAPLQPLMDYYAKHKSANLSGYRSYKFNQWTRLCSLMKIDTKVSGVVDLSSTIAALQAAYPMLSYLPYSWHTIDKNVVKVAQDYVNLVDKNI